jgi:hypothetical protein
MDFLKVGNYKDFVEKYETEELLTLGDLTLDMDT